MNTLKAIAIAITLFFAPIYGLILLVIFSTIIDTIFGIIASKVVGEPIISNKFYRFFTKSLVFILLVSLTWGADYLILNAILVKKIGIEFFITNMCALAIVIYESFSIDEKIKKMNKGKGLWFYFKKVIGTAKLLNKEIREVKEDIEETIETKKED